MTARLRPRRVLLALLIAELLVTPTMSGPAAAQDEPAAAAHAAVRAVWAGDGEGPVDVWIGEVVAFAGLTTGQVAPYTAVAPGAARLALAIAAESGDEEGGEVEVPALRRPPEEPVADTDLEPGSYYTLVLAGSEPDDPATIRFALLQDRHTTVPPAAHASLRFVHADPGREGLTLLVRSIDGDRGAARRPPAAEPIDGGRAGLLARLEPLEGSDHVPLLAGRYRLWWYGPDEDPASLAPFEVELRPATAYTLFATRGGDGEASAPLLVIDAGAPQSQGVDE